MESQPVSKQLILKLALTIIYKKEFAWILFKGSKKTSLYYLRKNWHLADKIGAISKELKNCAETNVWLDLKMKDIRGNIERMKKSE